MRQALQYKNKFLYLVAIATIALTTIFVLAPQPVYAGSVCGEGDQKAEVSIDFGCRGKGNSITDAAFAIIRFLTLGVGLIIVGSLTFAGLQYTISRGDPKATAEAIGRIRANIVAFLVFLFAYAILGYVIPEGFIGL